MLSEEAKVIARYKAELALELRKEKIEFVFNKEIGEFVKVIVKQEVEDVKEDVKEDTIKEPLGVEAAAEGVAGETTPNQKTIGSTPDAKAETGAEGEENLEETESLFTITYDEDDPEGQNRVMLDDESDQDDLEAGEVTQALDEVSWWEADGGDFNLGPRLVDEDGDLQVLPSPEMNRFLPVQIEAGEIRVQTWIEEMPGEKILEEQDESAREVLKTLVEDTSEEMCPTHRYRLRELFPVRAESDSESMDNSDSSYTPPIGLGLDPFDYNSNYKTASDTSEELDQSAYSSNNEVASDTSEELDKSVSVEDVLLDVEDKPGNEPEDEPASIGDEMLLAPDNPDDENEVLVLSDGDAEEFIVPARTRAEQGDSDSDTDTAVWHNYVDLNVKKKVEQNWDEIKALAAIRAFKIPKVKPKKPDISLTKSEVKKTVAKNRGGPPSIKPSRASR